MPSAKVGSALRSAGKKGWEKVSSFRKPSASERGQCSVPLAKKASLSRPRARVTPILRHFPVKNPSPEEGIGVKRDTFEFHEVVSVASES